MATKHSDGCWQRAEDDEELFTLLARDPIAPVLVRLWAALGRETGQPVERVEDALSVAERMDVWRRLRRPQKPTLAAGIVQRESLPALQREAGEWGARIFPHSTHESLCAHLREEIEELAAAAPDDRPEEAADVLLVLLSLVHREGFDLLQAARAKFAECQRRTWEFDPERGYVRHISGSE